MNEGYVIFYSDFEGLAALEVKELKDFISMFVTDSNSGEVRKQVLRAPTEILAVFYPGTAKSLPEIEMTSNGNGEHFFLYTDSSGFLETAHSDTVSSFREITEQINLERYDPEDGYEDDPEELFYAFSSNLCKMVSRDKVEILVSWSNYINLRPSIKDIEDLDKLDAIVNRNLDLSSI